MSTLSIIEHIEGQFLILNAVVVHHAEAIIGSDVFMTMHRSDLADFERKLAIASGEPLGSNNVYGITQQNSPTLYVSFHDVQVSFGLTIR